MLILYSILLALLWPLVFLAFVWRFGLRRTLAGLGERFGGGPKAVEGRRIWIHAASVGEVRAAETFLRALAQKFPAYRRALTTTTLAGKELAQKLALAEEVRLAPLDFPFCVRRLLCRWKPSAVVLVETELWPHWIRTLDRRGVPTVVVNGRISDKAFPSYYWLRSLWEPLLARLTKVGVQGPAQASRFLQLGALPDHVTITGNLKYDVPLPDPSRRAEIFARYGFAPSDKIWVCGSTHEGEEEPLIDALIGLRRSGHPVKMALAPRHVERARNLADLLARKGLSFLLRSSLAPHPQSPAPDVLILDTVGELPEVYGLAAFAFVGGSLIPRGGQNPLEPARWGVPVLFGPHMNNFQEIADLFLKEKAAWQVSDTKDLEGALGSLVQDPARAAELGQAARRAAESQRGAVDASLYLLNEALSGAGDRTAGSCGSSCACL